MDIKNFLEKGKVCRNEEDYEKENFIAPIKIKISDLKDNEKLDFFGLTFENMTHSIRKELLGIDIKILDSGNFSYTEEERAFHRHDLRNISKSEKLDIATYESIVYGKQGKLSELKDSLMLAFWLYKEGGMSLPIFFQSRGYAWQYYQYCYETKKYVITKKEFDEIKDLSRKIRKINDKKNDILKVRFYELMKKGKLAKNRFIDAVTIIESLITSDTKTEKSFKFSLYSSFILNKYSELKISFSKFNKIYSVRSDLLHTGESKNYDESLLNDVKRIVRELLKIYYSKKMSFSEKEIKSLILKELNISL